jgi:hypothetical protein
MKHKARDEKGRFCKTPKTVELVIKGDVASSINNSILIETLWKAINTVVRNGFLETLNNKFKEGADIIIIPYKSLFDELLLKQNYSLFSHYLSNSKKRKFLEEAYFEVMHGLLLNYGLYVVADEKYFTITKIHDVV